MALAMPLVKIPGGLNLAHFSKIREIQQDILNDLANTGARRVGSRLNKTDKVYPSPVFVGILEDAAMRADREKRYEADPGVYRLLDDDFSVMYNRTVSDPQGEFQGRDWNIESDRYEKTLGDPSLNRKGVKYQSFIAIRVHEGQQKRSVGILSVGFNEKPEVHIMKEVQNKMKYYAKNVKHDSQLPDSPLVEYLRETFELGGPLY